MSQLTGQRKGKIADISFIFPLRELFDVFFNKFKIILSPLQPVYDYPFTT